MRSPPQGQAPVRTDTAAGPHRHRTCLVVVGEPIGTGDARQQTAIGETPDRAARLQGLAAPNGLQERYGKVGRGSGRAPLIRSAFWPHRATLSDTAGRRCWYCRMTCQGIRCRPRSMSPRWRPTPRSRCSHGRKPAEATHDRPRAPFPPAAHPDARCRAIARITRDRVEVLVEPSLISQDGIIADADSC